MKAGRFAQALAVGIAALGLAGIGTMGQVVIGEIAWAGTAASAQDEWIELRNVSDSEVDLTGWALQIGDGTIPLGEVAGATLEVRRASIEPGGFFLLERTDDTTVSDVEADLIYKGGLSNGGEDVLLIDAEEEVVDQVLAAEEGWPGGAGSDGVPSYASMERFDAASGDADWGTNPGEEFANGLDADGNPLNGTPRQENGTVRLAAVVPRVDVLAPAEGTVSGRVVVEWAAVDPDGDDAALPVSVILSQNETTSAEAPGETLVENLANTGSFVWDTTTFADGTYYVFVLVRDADGYATTSRSGAIDVVNGG